MLCSSVHVEQTQMMEIPEAAVLMDQYAGRGLDFIVDIGQRVRHCVAHPPAAGNQHYPRLFLSKGPTRLAVHVAACTMAALTHMLCRCLQVVEGSTVIDMTGSEPKLIRMGKGNPSIFLQAEEAELGLA